MLPFSSDNTEGETSEVSTSSISGLTIAVDAGHGGQDLGESGTISQPDGTVVTIYEKNLTLMFAEYLEDELTTHGVNVFMTRSSDVTVGINERYEMATEANVDAFISIHFDWIEAPNGTLTLYGQNRTQDRAFAQTIHNAIVNASNYFGNDRGLVDCSQSGLGFLGVLNYGGDYPRALVEVNNMDYNGLYGTDLMNNAVDFAIQVRQGLENFF